MVWRLAQKLQLAESIDRRVAVLKRHQPYHESDHVLNLVYSVVSTGGLRRQDLQLRREDTAYLDALEADKIPAPTTAGDSCGASRKRNRWKACWRRSTKPG